MLHWGDRCRTTVYNNGLVLWSFFRQIAQLYQLNNVQLNRAQITCCDTLGLRCDADWKNGPVKCHVVNEWQIPNINKGMNQKNKIKNQDFISPHKACAWGYELTTWKHPIHLRKSPFGHAVPIGSQSYCYSVQPGYPGQSCTHLSCSSSLYSSSALTFRALVITKKQVILTGVESCFVS